MAESKEVLIPASRRAAHKIILEKLEVEEAALSKLEKQLEERREIISKLRAQLPPGPLPNEIWSHIFLLAAAEWFYYPYQDESFGVLSVCRHWRSIALATPQLWSKFELTYHTRFWGYSLDPLKIPPLFNTWMERAAGASLTIALDTSAFHRQVWDRLIDSIDQWESLTLSVGDEDLFTDGTIPWHKATSLKQLHLLVHPDLPASIPPTQFLKLRSLRAPSQIVNAIEAPDISDLDITCEDSSDLLHAARSFPALTTLVARVKYQQEEFINEQSPANLFPNVVDFTWAPTWKESRGIQFEPSMLSSMPSLTAVALDPAETTFPPFRGLIFSKISKLTLSSPTTDSFKTKGYTDFIDPTFPNIRELVLERTRSDVWLEALSSQEGLEQRYLWPRLEKLQLRDLLFEPEDLIRFAKVRGVPRPRSTTADKDDDSNELAQCFLTLAASYHRDHDSSYTIWNLRDVDFATIQKRFEKT